jgi:superfamily II DNA/RNA helicase
MVNENLSTDEETMALTFATDLELGMVRKIEQALGQKIPVGELPDDLIIEKERKKTTEEEKPAAKKKTDEPVAGEAFHEKKASNSKTYNYSSGEKAKMNKKKKYG